MLHRLLLLAPLATACAIDAQDVFTADRSEIPCEQAVPVCGTIAGCALDASNYTGGSFAQGATKRIVVRTDGAATIAVSLFFVTQGSPGLDTSIAWFEVGCRDRQEAASDGADVFAEAGPERTWTRTMKVTTAGDHLVELFSDAQAEYLVRVSVTPEE